MVTTRKRTLWMALLCCMLASLSANAYNKLSIPDVLIQRGGSIELPVNLENDDQIVALQFTLTVPNGFSLDVNSPRTTNRSAGHALRVKKMQGNNYLCMLYSANNAELSGNRGAVMYVKLKAPNNANVGDELPMTMSEATGSDIDMNNVLDEAVAGTITIAQYPDLVVTNVTTDASRYAPEDHIVVSWNVHNSGQLATQSGWSEKIALVDEDGTTCLLGTTYYNTTLDAGGTVSRQADIVIPRVPGMHGTVTPQVLLVPNANTGEGPEAQSNNTAQGSNVQLDAKLYLSISKYFVEETYNKPLNVYVTRSGNREQNLTVSLTCDDSRLSLLSSVTIEQGQSSAYVIATLVDNSEVDDNDKASITANASGYPDATAVLTIEDDEHPTLTATASAREVTEGDSFTVTVSTDKTPSADLAVTVNCSLPERFEYPATITIKAGQTSATAEFTAVDDLTPDVDQEVTFSFSADKHEADEVWITLHDNDVPDIELTLTPAIVSEGAGANAVLASLKRLNHTDSEVTIILSDDSDGELSMSTRRVTMAAGKSEAQFSIGVIDNKIVDGERTFNVTAAIYIKSCSCQAQGGQAGHVTKPLTVTDNDGATITLTSSRSTVAEGTEATLTVTRNANFDQALTVTLSSDNEQGLTYVHQVTIPAGESSAQVVLAVENNDQTNDDHLVTLQATADGFATGTCWIMITNQTLPDAQIADFTLSTQEVVTGDAVEATITVTNSGSTTMPSHVRTVVYIDNGTELTRLFTTTVLEPGESEVLNTTFTAPDMIGSHQVYAVVNDNQAVHELITGNNTSTKVDLAIIAPFSATLTVEKPVYQKGETVVFTGMVTGRNVANAEVGVYIINNGSRQSLTAVTDENGNFTASFKPLDYQMGHFIAGACYPGENARTEMTSFDILGLKAWSKKTSKSYESLEIGLGDTYEGTIVVSNPGDLPQSGLTLTQKVQSPNCDFHFDTPTSIEANGTAEINFTITGNAVSEGNDWQLIPLEISTAEGPNLTFTIYYYVHQQTGKLEANVTHINTTMTYGEARKYPVTITNVGKGETGTITMALPSWIQTSTPSEMASLAQGESANIVLRFLPTADMKLNVPVTGRIGINCENGDGTFITFKLTPVSDVNGTFTVDAVDEFTFYTEEAPHVSGATVKIKRPISSEIVAEGVTGADGTFTCEIPEGWYTLTIDADKHNSYSNTIIVDPGVEKIEEAFLSYQAVSYSWDVVETEVEDEYETTLVAEFETRVPKPVVIITLPDERPEPYSIFPINFTNVGMMRAVNVNMSVEVSEGYTIELLNDAYLDSLEAQQQYVLFARIIPTNAEDPDLLKATSRDVKCFTVISKAKYQELCEKYTGEELAEAIKRYGTRGCVVGGTGGSGSGGGHGGGGGGPGGHPGGGGGGGTHYDDTYTIWDTDDPAKYCDPPKLGPGTIDCEKLGEQEPLLIYKLVSTDKKKLRLGVATDGLSQVMISLSNEAKIPGEDCSDSYSYMWRLEPEVGQLDNLNSVDNITYTAPENFPDNTGSEFTVKAILTYTNNSTGESKEATPVNIKLIRVPVLFVHGLHDSGNSWNEMIEYLSQKEKLYRSFQLQAADYARTHNETFDTNVGVVRKYATDVLLPRVDKWGYVATKIDAVGHSMGGLLIKQCIQDDGGDEFIQRAITLNTPHGGSQLGDFLNDERVRFVRDIQDIYEYQFVIHPTPNIPIVTYEQVSKTPHPVSREILKYIYREFGPISGDMSHGAVSDLSVKGNAINRINNNSTSSVKCHAITTTTRTIIRTILDNVFGAFEYSGGDAFLNELFNGDESDIIVPLKSQQGGLYPPYVSSFSGGWFINSLDFFHSNTMKSNNIKEKMSDLLRSGINDGLFANGFQNTGEIEFIMPTLNNVYSIYTSENSILPNSAVVKQHTQLKNENNPSDTYLDFDYQFQDGDSTVSISINHSDDFSYISVGGFYNGQLIGCFEGDEGTLDLPKKINDDVIIMYEGKITDDQWYAISDTIRFNTIGTSQLESIRFNLDTLYLTNDIYATIKVVGTWDDGQQTDINEASLYVENESVAFVDNDDRISGKSQGRTTLIASHQGLECRIPIIVDDYSKEEEDEGNESESVCSTVTLSFKQKAVMTRQAFRGTLTINNGHDNAALENIVLNLTVRDEDGKLATSHEFQINCESLDGFSGEVDLGSGWSLAASSTGVATILFIPTKYAAPTEPKNYSFGGTFSYSDPSSGLTVTRELNPVTLTVNPSPNLVLDYFMQRDIYGDDPLTTDVVEPMQDAEFALIIDNQGYGDANNFTLTTHQPEIIDNEKGLLIDFQIVSSQLNGERANMVMGDDVANDFGTISAHSQAYAQWWLNSTLLGHFINYEVSYNHVTSYGNEDLSLIDTVMVHELIHGFTTDDVTGKRMRGFLVNDMPDADDMPDNIHFTNATQERVAMSNAVISRISDTEYLLDVTSGGPGWNYGFVNDPTLGRQKIVTVVRQSDGKTIYDDNVWTTDRVLIDGHDWLYENRLHYVVEMSGLAESYLISFEPKPDDELAVESFDGVPAEDVVLNEPLTSITVNFNKPIEAATFTTTDITLNCQGKAVDVADIGITPLSDSSFELDLSQMTMANGFYVLTVQTRGIKDLNGFSGYAGKQAMWTQYMGGTANLVVTVEPEQGGTAQPASGEYPINSTLHMIAQAEPGYSFMYWKSDDKMISQDAQFDYLLMDDATLTAVFQLSQFSVEILYDAEQGTVTGGNSQIYDYGTELELTAVPAAGYEFDYWSVNGEHYSTNSELTITVDDNFEIKAVFKAVGTTAAPVIDYEITEDAVIITATGEGDVKLYVNGEPVENPCIINREDADVTIVVTATAQQEGMAISDVVTLEITIPAKDVTPVEPEVTATPEISLSEIALSYVMIHVQGEGDLTVWVNGEEVTLDANGNYVLYADKYMDMTYVVTATAQEPGKQVSETAELIVVVPAHDDTGLNELNGGKQVVNVRYFNMIGQEMAQPDGMTIIVTTYSDGSTSAVKVKK